MRIILLLLLSYSFCYSQNPDLNQIRKSFINADKSEENCNTLLDKSEQLMENNDIAKAYNAAGLMISCEFKINPFIKWNIFNCGKNILKELIAENDSILEMRFLRYCMQKKAPSFLNYNDKIEEDALLITNANNALNKELLDFINPIFISLNDE